MSVDLSAGLEGRIKFERGAEFWCPLIEKIGEDEYSVRIESGWYKTYRRNGESICAGVIVDKNGNVLEHVSGKAITEFEPMGWQRASELHLPGETTP